MPGGRPSKFTPEVAEKIVKALSVGAPAELAARGAGVSFKSFSRWMKKGESQRKGELRRFFLQVVEIQGQALLRWLAVIDKAALGGDWKAAAWKAEHAHPEFFGKASPGSDDRPGKPMVYEDFLDQLMELKHERANGHEAEEPIDDPLDPEEPER
jgi:hypothetical protein